MINGIKPKGLKCSMCNDTMPNGRLEMGYTICTKCSTEEKVSCHTIYPVSYTHLTLPTKA